MRKGQKVSEETRQRMSQAQKGRIVSEETKKNISISRKGIPLGPPSEETRIKISEALKGRKQTKPPWNKGVTMSDEFREKMSRAKKGKPSPHKGVKYSDEIRLKMSLAHKGKPNGRKGIKASEEARKKNSEAQKGKIITEETRRKMSDSLKGRIITPETKAKISAKNKGRQVSEEHREYLSMKAKEWFLDPANREKHALRSISGNKKYKNGIYHSDKIPCGSMRWLSSYELQFYKNLDEDSNVLSYQRPKVIPYEFEGKLRTYLPDVLVTYINGDWEVFEVKPSDRLNDSEVIAKANAAKNILGSKYKFITEHEIFKSSELLLQAKEILDEELDKATEEIKKRFIEMLKKNGRT